MEAPRYFARITTTQLCLLTPRELLHIIQVKHRGHKLTGTTKTNRPVYTTNSSHKLTPECQFSEKTGYERKMQ